MAIPYECNYDNDTGCHSNCWTLASTFYLATLYKFIYSYSGHCMTKEQCSRGLEWAAKDCKRTSDRYYIICESVRCENPCGDCFGGCSYRDDRNDKMQKQPEEKKNNGNKAKRNADTQSPVTATTDPGSCNDTVPINTKPRPRGCYKKCQKACMQRVERYVVGGMAARAELNYNACQTAKSVDYEGDWEGKTQHRAQRYAAYGKGLCIVKCYTECN